MFIISFTHKNKRWPKCCLIRNLPNDLLGNKLSRLIEKKPEVVNEYNLKIPIEYWQYIKFEREIDFDDFLDFTEMLSDTAISPSRSHFYSVYSKDILNIPPPSEVTESRRTPL